MLVQSPAAARPGSLRRQRGPQADGPRHARRRRPFRRARRLLVPRLRVSAPPAAAGAAAHSQALRRARLRQGVVRHRRHRRRHPPRLPHRVT